MARPFEAASASAMRRVSAEVMPGDFSTDTCRPRSSTSRTMGNRWPGMVTTWTTCRSSTSSSSRR